MTAAAYIRMGIAAVAGAPVLWVCTVIFLTVLGGPR
jgi:hypothetical protein